MSGNFLVGPSELEKRRKRCAAAVHSLSDFGREVVLECNVCGSGRQAVIALRDRYGMPLRTALCCGCGLVYLVDRLTRDAYSDFYRDGAYRKLTSAFSGSPATIHDLQVDQAKYAGDLIRFLDGRVKRGGASRLLDVGGSSGKVAAELVKHFGVEGTVLDPSAEEIAAARKLGLKGIVGSAETWETGERFDLVLLCRTFEHVFDLRETLLKIRRLLGPNGLFYCDFLDYMELCRITGAPQTVSKVDHCYWTTALAAPALFRSLGFEVVSIQAVPNPQFVGLLLRPAPAEEMTALPWSEAESMLRTVREIESDWLRSHTAAPRAHARIRKQLGAAARGMGIL